MEDSQLMNDLEHILVKLKVIALCKPNQRLVFKGNTVYIQSNTWLTIIQRRIAGYDRKDIIEGLKLLLKDISRLIKDFSCKKECDFRSLERLKQDISNILIPESDKSVKGLVKDSTENKDSIEEQTGIHSLLITYENDQSCIAEITNIIEMYQNVLAELNDALKE